MVKDPTKLSRWEVLGTWLNLWTPPRDAHVPPIPWRKIGLGALALLLVTGIGLAIAIPRIDDAKTRGSAREQRALEARQEARRDRIRVEQRARTGPVRDAGDRGAALASLETLIGRDARERFHPRARAATCEPSAGQDAGADRVAYDCDSAIRDIVGPAGQKGEVGTIGIPYRAVVDFAGRTYAFCKVNPPPGEQIIPDPRDLIELPAACRA